MILFARRASTILYDILIARRDDRPFLLPANVCPVVPLTFLKARRPYEFVDIRKDSYCVDHEVVLEKVARNPNRYSGILFVRTYGITADPDCFFRRLKELTPALFVIDDKCLCVPEVKGTKESAADLELYSTGYSKYVDLGWGGFGYLDEGFSYDRHPGDYDSGALDAITAQVKAALSARRPFEYPDTDWLETAAPGITMEQYFGAITSKLATIRQHKEKLNTVYRCNLPQDIGFIEDGHVWRYNILVREKEQLLDAIFAAGLFASSHYASLGGIFGEGRFQHAESLHRAVVNLFNDFRFSEEQALKACEIVRGHVEGRHGL